MVNRFSKFVAASGAHRWRTTGSSSEFPSRGVAAPAGGGRRIASLWLAAVAGALLGTAVLAPALASTAPSIAETSTGANIAVQGPNHTLRFLLGRQRHLGLAP